MDGREVLSEFETHGKKRIGLFGGSFDPVHAGHVHLASLAKEAAGLDEVWFLPCKISPHKRDREPTAGFERVRWLETVIRDLSWARVDPTDLIREGISYSYQTLESLSVEFPENEWFWIMGGDQWTALPTWKNPERISELASFIVLARDGVEVLPRDGYRLQIVRGEHPASSTAIRKAIRAGGKKAILHLDPRIMDLVVSSFQ
ncbi:MAG: nicotinate (nicotinamide) nucleotide adenylyltransferase [Akkermansiaceae bacterium]